MLNILETQKKLVAAALPSGFEGRQAKVLEELARPYVDEMYYDALGNLICHKKGPGKRLMIPAHMDIIGFIAIYIDDNGFIRFGTIGGHVPLHLINTAVRFESGIRGSIQYGGEDRLGSKKFTGVAVDELYIDIGADSREEAEGLVKIGDVAVFDYLPVAIAGGNIMTPYADDLMACIVLLMAMAQVKDSPNDIYWVFTVQEERGLLGAKTAAHRIDPYMAIAIDLTRTGDTPAETVPMEVSLGKGPAIKVKDSSSLANPQVFQLLRGVADREGIAYQTEILLAGTTDAAIIQRERGGVLTGTVSIPGRNIHSPGEIINENDVLQVAKLIAATAMTEI